MLAIGRRRRASSVDLNVGIEFGDLPEPFLLAVRDDICSKRADICSKRAHADLGVAGEAPLPEVVAWLAGRPHRIEGAPELAPWL